MFEYFAKTISWFDKGEVVWLYDDGLKFVLEHRDCFTPDQKNNWDEFLHLLEMELVKQEVPRTTR
jgi:hypothetical protein